MLHIKLEHSHDDQFIAKLFENDGKVIVCHDIFVGTFDDYIAWAKAWTELTDNLMRMK